ncbi:DUF397 domain-containing protein [Streptomyces sp. Ncost-T10-10d]|uniref:DUF397 domain-containing protein n=1 Tax=Streptomyces sp. Ncost-T10-10d TaxID=1839774 RepID=UPI00081EA9CE|nr:DUF397 domain-containing protein [Streptomyces sp. Ncost-T10-10d]SCF94689.1 protein of unknown function [Streptomyces sp. Ncost-T10-10d]
MSSDLNWFKSSYSGENSGNCVEVAVAWTKSSYSGNDSGNCVEVATCPESVHVRDSKDLAVPALALSPAAWADFLPYVAQ